MKNSKYWSVFMFLLLSLFFFEANFTTIVNAQTKTQEIIKQLPFKRKFPASTKLYIYFSKKQIGEPTIIQGSGFWTLLFEPTNDPKIASVSLVDIKVLLSPFIAVYDADHDGKPESIKVDAIELGPKDIDFDASIGSVNVETGEFSLVISHILKPENILPLKIAKVTDPLKFSFTEKGVMDLESNQFKTYTGSFVLPKPFEGIMISGNEGPPCCPEIRYLGSIPESLTTSSGEVFVGFRVNFFEGGSITAASCRGDTREPPRLISLVYEGTTTTIPGLTMEWVNGGASLLGRALAVPVSRSQNRIRLSVPGDDGCPRSGRVVGATQAFEVSLGR